MTRHATTIDSAEIERPGYGEPCNGCGFCCKEEACDLSREYLKSAAAPCVALEHQDGRYWCGLVRNPAKYLGLQEWAVEFAQGELSPKFAYALRLGAGCDAYTGPEE
jgi:hypothetical protein